MELVKYKVLPKYLEKIEKGFKKIELRKFDEKTLQILKDIKDNGISKIILTNVDDDRHYIEVDITKVILLPKLAYFEITMDEYFADGYMGWTMHELFIEWIDDEFTQWAEDYYKNEDYIVIYELGE